eukprot:g29720.t1
MVARRKPASVKQGGHRLSQEQLTGGAFHGMSATTPSQSLMVKGLPAQSTEETVKELLGKWIVENINGIELPGVGGPLQIIYAPPRDPAKGGKGLKGGGRMDAPGPYGMSPDYSTRMSSFLQSRGEMGGMVDYGMGGMAGMGMGSKGWGSAMGGFGGKGYGIDGGMYGGMAGASAGIKTKMCSFFDSRGFCAKGNACAFAHGADELGKPADSWLRRLQSLPWGQGKVKVFGKDYDEPRLTCYFGEKAYKYSNRIIEPNGEDAMGWHSDNEQVYGPKPTIASVTLGAERDFDLREGKGGGARLRVRLAHGSLLVMSGATQECWQHSLPRRKALKDERINLTFRRIMQ